MWALVGLGNPGLKYRNTRHNAGYLLVRGLARQAGSRIRKRSFRAKVGVINMAGFEVLLVLPQTYMNKSGESVRMISGEGGIPPERMVVIYDDLDLPLGDIRIRREGRAGSHKGMASVVSALETQRFPRVRIGIGPLPPGTDAAEFVLSPFLAAERDVFEGSLAQAGDALRMIVGGDIVSAMNAYNGRVGPAKDGQDGRGQDAET